MTPVIYRTPIKVNLALHVTGKRSDGYHLLDSLVTFCPNGDVIQVTPAAADAFQIIGPYAEDLTPSSDNLVIKARDLLRQTCADTEQAIAVAVVLEKNLPIASGLGGGSGDAAATLLALNDIWQLNLSQQQLLELGLTLGADVPMCLQAFFHHSSLIARGIGEQIEILPDFPSLNLVIVNPGVAVSTAAIFKGLEKTDNTALKNLPPVFERTEDVVSYLDSNRNDLQQAACQHCPTIVTVLQQLQQHNALLARMSGSGASSFGLFASQEKAQMAAEAIQNTYPDWYVMACQSYGV